MKKVFIPSFIEVALEGTTIMYEGCDVYTYALNDDDYEELLENKQSFIDRVKETALKIHPFRRVASIDWFGVNGKEVYSKKLY